MATNSIGTGTRNLPVNAPVDWWSAIGQAATQAGMSIGAYVRALTELGARLDNPELAARLHEIRRQYYGVGMAVIMLALTIHAWFNLDDDETLRGESRVRVTRCQRTGRVEWEEA